MKTLKEHNAHMRAMYEARAIAMREGFRNGIECPNCKAELFDTDPTAVLMSNPPQKNIHCGACGFRGYRVA